MILINLLPPELRKTRGTGVNPVFLAAAAGILIVLGMAGLFFWVTRVRIPDAEEKLAQAKIELETETANADKVAKLEAQIRDFVELHASITGLITRKVFWAKTIDDFANMLAQANGNHWSMDGYQVCCTQFSVSPTTKVASRGDRDKAGESVVFNFRATFRIIGKDKDKFGDYAMSFFSDVDASPFWNENGFQGRSVEPFKSITANFKKEINYAVSDLSLEWKRAKQIPASQGAQR